MENVGLRGNVQRSKGPKTGAHGRLRDDVEMDDRGDEGEALEEGDGSRGLEGDSEGVKTRKGGEHLSFGGYRIESSDVAKVLRFERCSDETESLELLPERQ